MVQSNKSQSRSQDQKRTVSAEWNWTASLAWAAD